jgi:hypothetical protein
LTQTALQRKEISHGKAKRTRTFAESQSASRAGAAVKSKNKTAAAAAATEKGPELTSRNRSLGDRHMHPDLPGLTAKIGNALSLRSEYVVTEPAELRILREMSETEIAEFGKSHGWGVIRRLGGRQFEFYNDASLREL